MPSSRLVTGTLLLLIAAAAFSVWLLPGGDETGGAAPALDLGPSSQSRAARPLSRRPVENTPSSVAIESTPAQPASPHPEITDGILLRLRVVDENRSPISGAKIASYQPEEMTPLGQDTSSIRGHTDADGRFEHVVPKGPRKVHVSAEGFAPELLDWHPTEDWATVQLRGLAAIAGRVRRPNGRPIPNSLVEARIGKAHRRRDRQAKTDTEGRFLLTLPPGRYDLEALGHTLAENVPTGRTDLDLVLAFGSVVGRIQNARTGNPLEDEVGVMLESAVGGASRRTGAVGGRFQFEVAAGDYRLVIDSRGYSPVTIDPVEVRSDQVTEVDIVLEPVALLEGRVLSRVSGQPIWQAQVAAMSGDSHARPRARTDREGRFSLPLASDGDWELLAEKQGFALARRRVFVPEGESRLSIEIVLDELPSSTVAGRVVRAGVPVPELRVQVASGNVTKSSITDEAGRFEIASLLPGPAELAVTEQGRRLHQRPLTLRSGERRTVDIDREVGLRISGQVWIGDEPEPGAVVYIEILSDEGRASLAVAPQRTDAEGRFQVSGLWPGEYLVTATRDGDRRDAATWARIAGAEGEDRHVDLRLGAASLELVVRDGEGRPVGNALVFVHPLGVQDDEVELVMETADDGTAHFRSVTQGRIGVTVEVSASRRVANLYTVLDLGPGPNRHAIELSEGARLSIELSDTGRTGFAFLSSLEAPFLVSSGDVVPPGTYEILAGARGRGARRLPRHRIDPGEDIHLEVDLTSLAVLELITQSRPTSVRIVDEEGFDHAPFGHFPYYPLEPGRYQVEVQVGANAWQQTVHMGSENRSLSSR